MIFARRPWAWLLLVAAALTQACGGGEPAPGSQVTGGLEPLELGRTPHTSLLLVEGLDRSDLPCWGGSSRPALDRLASLGTRFDSFLAVAPDERVALHCMDRGTWPSLQELATPGDSRELAFRLCDVAGLSPRTGAPADFVAASVGASEPLFWSSQRDLTVDELEAVLAELLSSLEAAGPEVSRDHLIVLAGTGRFDGGEPDGAVLGDGRLATPLLIAWPGTIPAGESRPQVLGHPDLLPTLLELLGAAGKEQDLPSGQSFARLAVKRTQVWRGSHLSFSPAEKPAVFRLRTTAWIYQQGPVGQAELFDLRLDPEATENRFGEAGVLPMQGVLHEQLVGWIQACGLAEG